MPLRSSFARVEMNTPAEADEVSAAALGACVALARRTSDDQRAALAMTSALSRSSPPPWATWQLRYGPGRSASEDIYLLDVRPPARNGDDLVRAQVLNPLAFPQGPEVDDPLLTGACRPDGPLGLRATAARIERDRGGVDGAALSTLRSNLNTYVRAVAHETVGMD